jgi:O-antigen ligase
VTESTVAHIAAAVSPLVFELVRRRHREAPWLWLGPVLLVLLVLLSGRRVAWMMLVVASFAYGGYIAWRARRVPWRRLAAVAALLAAGFVAAYTQHDLTRERVETTLDLLSTDRGEVDLGTSYRLDLWATTVRTARAHWPLGVGALGSRHDYANHAAPDDFWIRHGYVRVDPHQLMLEIAADTGLAGLLGYLIALAVIVLTLARSREPWVWSCGIALAVALFPLNSHIALYSSYWSMAVWWLVGLTAAALSSSSAQERSPGDRLSV